MKGSIVRCAQELVEQKYGAQAWKDILTSAGQSPNLTVLDIQDIPDEDVAAVLKAAMAKAGLTRTQLADAFGEQWVMSYSQYSYAHYYTKHSTAKDFLLSMDSLHVTVTRTVKNAHPPRFEYIWQNPKTLHMRYNSSRNMIDFLVGLVRAVGKFYKENLAVRKLNEGCVEIVFPA